MAFEGLDVSISGSSGDAKAAIASVKSSLSGLSREANDAQDSLEEMNDEAAGSTTRLSALTATAGASALSVAGLSSAATGATGSLTALTVSAGTVTTALAGAAAVAAPLAATLGTMAAAAGGLAAGFGAVVGSGLLAFGQQQAETMEDASTATEALAQTAADLKAEITPLVADLGEAFVPLIEDAVDAIPELAEGIIDALGPLDEFASTLRDFGEIAMEAIPATVEAFVDLGRRALPFVEDLVDTVGDGATAAFEGMIEVTEVVGDDLLAVADAAGDLIPELTQLGTTIIQGAAPAVEELIGFVEDLIGGFNDFTQSADGGAVFRQIKQEILPLIPRVRELFAEFKPLLDAFIDNLPQIIDLFGGFADSVLDIANTVIPVIVPPLTKLIDLIGDVSGALAKWIERSDEGRDKISSDALFLKSTYQDVANAITEAFSYLTGSGDGSLQGDISASVSAIGDAFGRLNFGSFGSALGSVADGVRSLIDSLNELSGVNIDVDVPSFDDLLDEAKDIVEPVEEEEDSGFDDPAFGGGGGRGNRPPDDDDPGMGGDDGDDGDEGGTGAPNPPSNPGVPGVGVATGGFVESAGAAMLHSGERVVPEAQIADRGPAPIEGGGTTIVIESINASGRAEGREAGRALKRELKRFDI